MKILVIGPSIEKSKGGMASVIRQISEDDKLNNEAEIDIFSSFRDGPFVIRLIYSLVVFFKFTLICSNYDLIHLHMASYGSTRRKMVYYQWARKKKVPVVAQIHGAEYKEYIKSLSEKRKNKLVKLLNSLPMVIVLSNKWKSFFSDELGLNNVKVLYNGVFANNYQVVDIEINKSNFLFLGRVGKRKGVFDLIRAFSKVIKKHPTALLTIAGDGEIGKAQKLVDELGIQKSVRLVGWVDGDEKIELLKNNSTVVLPSYNEGLPMTILEAMAAGRYIVSTSVGGIPEVVIDGENGELIRAGMIDDIYLAINNVIEGKKELKEISNRNSRKIRQKYDVEVLDKLLLNYYEEALLINGGKSKNRG